MNQILGALGVAVLVTLSYIAGTYVPAVVNEEPTASEYIRQHDQGCNSIVRYEDGSLVCMVKMQEEDDVIHIIKPYKPARLDAVQQTVRGEEIQ